IGVVVANADDAILEKGLIGRVAPDATFLGGRAANSSYLGYFWIPEPEGTAQPDFWERWMERFAEKPMKNEPRHRPPAKWIESPFRRAVLAGRPPLEISIHHGMEVGFATEIVKKCRQAAFGRILPEKAYREKFLAAGDLVGVLLQDTFLKRALMK